MTSLVVEPGTASCFWPNSGTQNEWVTSSEVIRSSTGAFSGSFSVAEVSLPKSGYWKLQANCCAVTSTTSGFSGFGLAAEAFGRWSFLASTIALTPLLPADGGPRLDDGDRRDLGRIHDAQASIVR